MPGGNNYGDQAKAGFQYARKWATGHIVFAMLIGAALGGLIVYILK